MNGDVFAVGSPFLCGSDILVVQVHGYGNIVLKIENIRIVKPDKKIINQYKYEDLPEDCKPLFKKETKELNISMKKIDYILLDQRDEYTIYEFSYMNLKAYVVVNWNGYSAEFKFEVFDNKDDAISWVFSR